MLLHLHKTYNHVIDINDVYIIIITKNLIIVLTYMTEYTL